MQSVVPEGLTDCSENSDLGSRNELEKVMEGYSWWKRPRLWTEIILVQTFFYNTLSNGLANLIGIEKLEL